MIDVLLDNLSIGFYSRHIADDGTRTYMYFNRLMQEFFGCEYVPDSNHWSQEDDDNLDTNVLLSTEPIRIERQIKDEEGANKWLVFIKRKAEATDGKNGYIIVTTVIDVTSRKEEELLLEKSRTSLQLATSAANISTWELDTESQEVIITNGLDVHSRTVSLNEHILKQYYNNDSQTSYSDLLDVMSGKMDAGKGFYMMKDDNTGEILYRKTFFKGVKENGNVTQVYGITQDVTDVFRNRELVRNNRDELNLALEAGCLSAWSYNPTEKIFYTLYGETIAKKGLSLKKTLKILHPDDREKLVSYIDYIISGKDIKSDYDFVFRFKDADAPNGYRYYDSKMKGRLKDGKVVQIIGTQRDVTDEILYRKRLEEFNLKTNLINNATQSILWDYDTRKHALFTYSDKALLPNQPISMEKYLTFVHPNDREQIKKLFIDADNRTLDNFSFEIDLMLPGYDSYRRIVSNGVAVRDEDGNIIKYTGVRKDISEITKLNHELQNRNILKDVVVNNVFVGLILFSVDYKVQWNNDYAATSFSEILHSEKCIEGTHCKQLIKHEYLGGQIMRLLQQAIETGNKQELENMYGDKWVEITAIPAIDVDSRIVGALLKIRDITQQKQMLEELEKSREEAIRASEFVSTFMDKMPAPIFIEDPDNDFRIIRVNEAFCTLFHIEKSEAVGKSMSELFGKEMSEKHESYDRMLVNGNIDDSITYEGEVIMDGMAPQSYLIHKSLMLMRGHYYILAISSDVTQLKKMNDELAVAKEKALSADKLKTAFLANMSHEIRTPLNAIVGFSELLFEADDPKEKAEYHRIIVSSNELLLRLIGDILDLSKIESGTTEFKRELVNVSSYFNELTASLAIKCTNPDVKFIVDNPYKACYVNFDKMRFGQVITNFVTNAIKYTRKGYIKVGYYIENNGITIRVEDTGFGIDVNKRDRVFTRFDKLDSMAQGTGLGLSISKILTETGGGKIWFESEEGKGSTFYSWKPFPDIKVQDAEGREYIPEPSQESKHEEKEATSSVSGFSIRKILVAEDHSSNFLLLKKILSDYELEWAKNGVEAVEKVARSRFDLVLMDIKMPIMDGLDATRQIRKFNSNIPIVAVTANAYAADKEEALLAGCDDFLAKPILKKEIYGIIEKIQSAEGKK